MADSDGEFVADNLSDDDYGDHQVTRGGDDGGAHGSRRGRDGRRRQNRREEAAWETVKRSWEQVGEGEDGRLTVTDFIEAEKRRRLLRDTTPLQRGIIRHLLLVLDMSFAMAAKDYLPNMYRVVMNYSIEFVREYFEQNPISQLGIVGMKDGIAVRISDMSGNPAEHIAKLRQWVDIEPQGNPSLQNALEMCRGALFHAPSHGTREVLIIYGALLSSDPGDIHDTIASLISDRIRVSIVGLAAQVAICSEICSKTNAGDETCYAVAKHDAHCRELMLNVTTPPVTRTREMNNASLLMMGFPSRSIDPKGTSVCACHNKPFREGYACTRCRTKVCRLPAECPACGLTLILSTHLARSYHHLFPLRNWVEVPWSKARSKTCFACLSPFPERRGKGSAVPPSGTIKIKIKGRDGVTGAKDPADDQAPAAPPSKGVSESGRYACQVCGNHFCIDCDVYAHEVVHNCPGCQSDTRAAQAAAGQVDVDGSANGNTQANGDMIVDS